MSSASTEWELDFYSRPVLDENGKKRWELLICSADQSFRWSRFCPANSVNSMWLKAAIEEALALQGAAAPRRLRCWRSSMRTMVQRAAAPLGLEVLASRRCYGLVDWLRERERTVYPSMEGHLSGPLAPPPSPMQPLAIPLPEAVRGDSWSWAQLPAESFSEAADWQISFAGLVPLPECAAQAPVAGLRLFSPSRALALAGWLAGLEPVRLEVRDQQLVLEAGLEDRWLVSDLQPEEAEAASTAFQLARDQAGGLQFLAVQTDETATDFAGFWLLRDLPDC